MRVHKHEHKHVHAMEWWCHTCGDRLYKLYTSLTRRHGDHEIQRLTGGTWTTWLRPAADIEAINNRGLRAQLAPVTLLADPYLQALVMFTAAAGDRATFEAHAEHISRDVYDGWATALGLTDEEHRHSRATTSAIIYDRLAERAAVAVPAVVAVDDGDDYYNDAVSDPTDQNDGNKDATDDEDIIPAPADGGIVPPTSAEIWRPQWVIAVPRAVADAAAAAAARPLTSHRMDVLRREHSALCTIASAKDPEQRRFIELICAHVRQPHIIPLLEQTAPSLVPHVGDLSRLKLEQGFSDGNLDAISRILLRTGPSSTSVRATIASYSSQIWRNSLCSRFSVNSLIDWIHILLSTPSLELEIQDAAETPSDDADELLICEYSETVAFRRITDDILARHSALGRSGTPIAIAYGDYVDKHEVHKGSCEALMFHILNLRRKVRDLPFLQLLVAELPGAKDDLNIVRRALLAEQIVLYNGIEMWVSSQTAVAWVYAVCDLQIADTQEQYKNVSCSAPGGTESFFCCPVCMASRGDFSAGHTAQLRDDAETTRATVTAALQLPSFKLAKDFLRTHGLMPSAMVNQNLFLPGVQSIALIQGRDPLHICLHDGADTGKILAMAKENLLPANNREMVESRIYASRQFLKGGKAPTPLRFAATWRGHEALAFILASHGSSILSFQTLPAWSTSR